MKTSHKLARMIIVAFTLMAIVYIATLGYFPSVGWADVPLLAAFTLLLTKKFRGICSRGGGHWSRAFAR